MENISTIIICMILAAVCVVAVRSYFKKLKSGCCGGGCGEIRIKPSDTNTGHYPNKITVYIDGMTCDGCKLRAENAFNRTDGVYAKVNLKGKYAEVWSLTPLNENDIRKTVEGIGYTYVKSERDCRKMHRSHKA